MLRLLCLFIMLQLLIPTANAFARRMKLQRYTIGGIATKFTSSTTTVYGENANTDGSIESLVASISFAGNQVRELKASKADKEVIKSAVAHLLSLKENYKVTTGSEFGTEAKVVLAQEVPKVMEKPLKVKVEPVEAYVPSVVIDYFAVHDDDAVISCGDYSLIASQSTTQRKYMDVASLSTKDSSPAKIGDKIWLRGRVSNVRAKGNVCFIVLRSNVFYTIQLCHFKDKANPEASKELIKFASALTLESIIDVYGTLVSADVKSCSQNDIEVSIQKLYTVSRAPTVLPFLLEDASRSESDIDASQATDRPFARVTQDLRLNNRWLDLRVPANNAIMRVKSGVSFLFREALHDMGFTEIITPKLIAGESEGGSDVFRTDYFGQPACLAQSPQLYKQMAISADMSRVYEIGPVFRAEKSNTRRHLCEFTGLDFEMAINEHYNEALVVIHRMLRHIFTGLETRYAKELAVIREEPLILHWPEGIALLKDAGYEVDDMSDLSTALELSLGELVKAKYNADFYILDQYPAAIRPFYTMPSQSNPLFSNSYDAFIRGQEICSGAQRCHDAELLDTRIRAKGLDPDSEGLKYYVESFRHGVSPHAGAGIGLERVVFLYLGLDNVRKASMFPRDPSRCTP